MANSSVSCTGFLSNATWLSVNGQTYMFGANDDTPQLVPKLVEVKKVGIDCVIKMSGVGTGMGHSVLLSEYGEMFVLGSNTKGQLGLPLEIQKTSSPTPGPVAPGNSTWKAVSCGSDHTLALTEDNKVYAFGNNEMGQIGRKRKISFTEKLHHLDFFDDKEVLQISCGYNHSAVTTSEGIYVFGDNSSGQACLGNRKILHVPTLLIISDEEPLGIACGQLHSAVVTASNTLYLGGYISRQFYSEDELFKFSFDEKILQVSSGASHVLVLTESGQVYGIGVNGYNQLGLDKNLFTEPTKIPSLGNITTIFAGWQQSFAVDVSGRILCWGRNTDGQLGLGHKNKVPAPIPATYPLTGPYDLFLSNQEFSKVDSFGSTLSLSTQPRNDDQVVPLLMKILAKLDEQQADIRELKAQVSLLTAANFSGGQ
eukprot:TRINITY_DN8666_c0_g1_i2.p1 TRINITY_DN8666_c0_g1~~TRINITY_DN8666_c0_g1_i2.p1  ORF type:complete len:425 (+),score=70.37 TRINITY_DN8666_c0_g1_i2:36-1310(+)